MLAGSLPLYFFLAFLMKVEAWDLTAENCLVFSLPVKRRGVFLYLVMVDALLFIND